jgi:hypothetical protein
VSVSSGLSGGARAPSKHGIAMWGPPGSGKTTFLAALSVALQRSEDLKWSMWGDDDASETKLHDMVSELTSGHKFPRPTDGIEQFAWVLNGPVRGGRKWYRRDGQEYIQVRLDVTDARGEIAGPQLGASKRAELIDNLTRSRGLVYIFDPMREFDEGDAFDHTFGMLIQLARRMDAEGGLRNGRLPHHVAVCVTKFDDPVVYETAEKMNLIDYSSDNLELPCVPDDVARELLLKLCSISESGNADMVVNSLERYFDPRRIKYFVTSAIGFYVSRGKYDPDDPRNLLRLDEINDRTGMPKTRIRGAVHPINVVEPVFWLIDQLHHGNGD